jgi:tetratricopeptide (TPR) repeat protein
MMGTHRIRRSCLLAALALGTLLMASCAPTLPRPYLESRAAAQRAYGAGRYDEAARHYHEAAMQASRSRDRDEMLFLEASALQRAGRTNEARAAYEALEKLSPTGERAARCAYEVASIEIEHGDEQRGWQMIESVMRRYPGSGLAKRALQRYVKHLDDTQGDAAGLAYLRANMAWLRSNDMGEDATYGVADHLERMGKLAEARDTFVECATAWPYPGGALWDDALYRASLLDEKLGDPRAAIARLDTMLVEREVSTFSGSYERPRYARAQMRKAELYRDALHDHAAARREFRKLFDEFTTSLLRDDAMWEAAKLAAQDQDTDAACESMKLLAKTIPDSRYVPCTQLVCPAAGAGTAPRVCRRYIERSVDRADPPAVGAR